MTYLLDVNVLVAIADPHHVHHEAAHWWFAKNARPNWATCSVTELGFIRVLSNPGYSARSSTPTAAAERLALFCDSGGHRFWADDLPPRSSLDDDVRTRLQGHKQVTDFHLAALALCYEGQLATFDGRQVRALAGTHLASAVMLVQ